MNKLANCRTQRMHDFKSAKLRSNFIDKSLSSRELLIAKKIFLSNFINLIHKNPKQQNLLFKQNNELTLSSAGFKKFVAHTKSFLSSVSLDMQEDIKIIFYGNYARNRGFDYSTKYKAKLANEISKQLNNSIVETKGKLKLNSNAYKLFSRLLDNKNKIIFENFRRKNYLYTPYGHKHKTIVSEDKDNNIYIRYIDNELSLPSQLAFDFTLKIDRLKNISLYKDRSKALSSDIIGNSYNSKEIDIIKNYLEIIFDLTASFCTSFS